MRRIASAALAAGALCSVLFGPAESAAGSPKPRLLVLSAFPAELDALLVHARIKKTVVIDGRSFFVGRLAGNRVVMALTGIGLTNAEKTARDAIGRFALGGIVFSGVAGSRYRIGDVAVPGRWTEDEGTTWIPVDPTMLSVAESVVASGPIVLERCAPLGDLACVGLPANVSTGVCLSEAPQVFVGGDGKSSDPFGGRAMPCVPFGGDVFGCDACRAPRSTPDVARFVSGASTFLDPEFLQDYNEWQASSATGNYDAADMETAAVARVARERGLPFLGVRAASDGAGDPLMLPGFPVQFFVYRQLAADNAAAVAIAFLEAWAVH